MGKEPDNGDPVPSTIPERLRVVLGDKRTRRQGYIDQARETGSLLTDEALTQQFIAGLPTDIVLAYNAFWRNKVSQAAEEIAHNFARLFNHGAQSDKDRGEALFDEQMAEGFYYVADLAKLVNLDLNNPHRIEFIDFTEEIHRDDLDYHPTPKEQRTINPLSQNKVSLTTPQVRYVYQTDLPGIELVVQFPKKGLVADTDRYYGYDFKKRTHDGQKYDFPLSLNLIHSIRLSVAPEAYVESLKENSVDQPPT